MRKFSVNFSAFYLWRFFAFPYFTPALKTGTFEHFPKVLLAARTANRKPGRQVTLTLGDVQKVNNAQIVYIIKLTQLMFGYRNIEVINFENQNRNFFATIHQPNLAK